MSLFTHLPAIFAQFSEVTGMSPGEYRRRYAGGDPIAPSQE